MKITRREAIKTATISVCAAPFLKAEAQTAVPGMCPLDYGRSFICNTAGFNAVRFWVESRTRIFDDAAGAVTDYYQCGACKSENTFAERDLFMARNYDFLPILGGGHWLIFRRPAGLSDTYRMIKPPDKMWGEPVLKLQEAPRATVLDRWEQIRDATAAALPLVTQTEIVHAGTGLRAIIECPCKTMNVSVEKQLYQVDTGPVAFPDLGKRHDPPIDCLHLAFLAFNAPDFADFVVEQPTAVTELCQVYHYSNPFSLPAKNRILALRGGPELDVDATGK
jgi:hypothetical protein